VEPSDRGNGHWLKGCLRVIVLLLVSELPSALPPSPAGQSDGATTERAS